MDVPSYLLGKQAGGGGGQPSLQNKSVTITENGTQNVTADTGYDGLNNVEVITNVSGGGGLDWSAIGYNSTPQAIKDGYDYAVEIMENWETVTDMNNMFLRDKFLFYMPLVDTSSVAYMAGTFQECTSLFAVPLLDTSSVTQINSMFSDCISLTSVPQLNTSEVRNFNGMFKNCTILKSVPQFNTSSCTDMRNMFVGCINLTDDSLDNILKMCININSEYSRTKALNTVIGNNSTVYPTSRIQALPHYQDFIDAGWTIGY